MTKTRRLSKTSKTDKTDKTRKAGKAATLALLTAALLGLATSDASAQERTLGVVAKNRVEAILVGVDEYASRNVESLTYAGADAKKLRDALTKIGVPEESVRLFVSRGGLRERPNKETIMAALDEAIENSGPNSTVLVALSGHGFETSDGEAAFCPEDAKISVSGGEVYVDKSSAILISDVAEKLRKDDAKFKLLIVDACRAPAGARTTPGRRSFVTGDASGLAFLQSCSSGESSWEDESVAGGLFTHYFVEGLSGAAADEEGGVSFLGVCDYAARRTKARARALRNASQTPFHRMSGVNFYLVEPKGTQGDDNDAAAKLAKANALFMEAFTAYEAGDYATARDKCKASLSEAQTTAAQKLLAKIDAAQSQTGGATATQATTAQSQSSTPPTGPSSSGQGQNSVRPSVDVAWDAASEAGTRKTLTVDGVEYAFRYCPAGTFQMGSPASESDRDADETLHDVKLTNGFWMLETEVTQAMWKSLMGDNPSGFSSGGIYSSQVSGVDTSNFPVENVSWLDCQDFIKKLNAAAHLPSGFQFRLPTEAEWEYACRAGTTGPYAGSSLDTLGWYVSNSGSRTHEVGKKSANGWGLHDMHGNVLEWCEDLKTDYENIKSVQDPINVTLGSYRVLRGGSWSNLARGCRSAYRYNFDPTNRGYNCGFRLVLGREL